MSWVNWQRDGWRHLERMDRSNFLEGQQEARAIAQRRTILTQGVRCLAILLGEEQTGKSVGSVSCHLILTELWGGYYLSILACHKVGPRNVGLLTQSHTGESRPEPKSTHTCLQGSQSSSSLKQVPWNWLQSSWVLVLWRGNLRRKELLPFGEYLEESLPFINVWLAPYQRSD